MTNPLERLAAIGSCPIAAHDVDRSDELPESLAEMLRVCNGYYAFESALHVFASSPSSGQLDLFQWNAPELWRSAFPAIRHDWWFFAEDAFGVQFATTGTDVSVFDPETGLFDSFAGISKPGPKRFSPTTPSTPGTRSLTSGKSTTVHYQSGVV